MSALGPAWGPLPSQSAWGLASRVLLLHLKASFGMKLKEVRSSLQLDPSISAFTDSASPSSLWPPGSDSRSPSQAFAN